MISEIQDMIFDYERDLLRTERHRRLLTELMDRAYINFHRRGFTYPGWDRMVTLDPSASYLAAWSYNLRHVHLDIRSIGAATRFLQSLSDRNDWMDEDIDFALDVVTF